MHSLVKKLASQTAMYGLSSILGRLLNYLLVPLHTRIFAPAEYGVVTEFYAYAAFFNILFTYGMETAFFRYTTLEENKKKVYDTALISLLFSSLALVAVLILLAQPIANAMEYPDQKEYIIWFALILGLDAVVAIPFARLRQENRPVKFAIFKLINILTNVGFNLFFLLLCPYILSNPDLSSFHGMVHAIYHPQIGVGYVFISNLIGSFFTLAVFMPHYIFIRKWEVNKELWNKMIIYAMPLIIVGLAGMVNETLSRAMLKYLLPVSTEEAQHQLGIFGACYKMSILMTLFVQAYKMAAEPFFFYESTQKNPQLVYAKTMNYFIIVCCFIFLMIMLFINFFKRFMGPEYYEGLGVVPVLLLANFFLGVYYNLTIWYKLTNKNKMGALVSIYGALVTIGLNFWWIPVWGYLGSSWVTLITYGTMMIISFFLGQKYYRVPYDIIRFFSYLGIAIGFYLLSMKISDLIPPALSWVNYVVGTILLSLFCALVFLFETGRIRVFKPIK